MPTRSLRAATVLSAIALAAVLSHLGHAQAHEAHLYFSAGQPGDPKKPARTVTISMREMQFEPSRIEVHKGEQIRFVLRNVGTESHEFVLATPDENRKHEEVMKKFPNMEHDDPNAKRVARSESPSCYGRSPNRASSSLPVSFPITVSTEWSGPLL